MICYKGHGDRIEAIEPHGQKMRTQRFQAFALKIPRSKTPHHHVLHEPQLAKLPRLIYNLKHSTLSLNV
jgi:hypothetical protein